MLLVLFSHLISYSRSAHARTPKRERDRERERERDSLVATGNCMHSSPWPLALLLHYICIAPVAPKSRVPSDLNPFSLFHIYIYSRTHEASEIPTHIHSNHTTFPFLKTRSKQILTNVHNLPPSLFVWFGSVWFGLVRFSSVFLKRRQPHALAWFFLVLDLFTTLVSFLGIRNIGILSSSSSPPSV